MIATLRSVSKSTEAVKTLDEKGAKVLGLDVANESAIMPTVEKALGIYGQIDTLVNNAAYSLLRAFEDMR